MSKKLMSLIVRGKSGELAFRFYGNPDDLAFWRSEGLEVNPIENTIPEFLPAGLEGVWCFFQDVFNFRNPWRRP